MIDYEELAEAMGDLDEDTVKELLETVMADGGSGAQQAMDACQKGMDIVGSRFESGEYFVGDLIYAGELMTDAVSILKDALVTGDGGGTKTKMILCTVKDDLHDIGKNIVRSMLEAAGFEVLDLGIDVPASEIVKAAKENSIKIVALSGVLTLAIDSMKATVEAFKADGMDDVKIIIGGSHEDHRRRRMGAQPPENRSGLQGLGGSDLRRRYAETCFSAEAILRVRGAAGADLSGIQSHGQFHSGSDGHDAAAHPVLRSYDPHFPADRQNCDAMRRTDK